MQNKFVTLLTSRKFWALIVGLIVVIAKQFNPNLPLTEDGLMQIIGLLAMYIFGTALQDGLTGFTAALSKKSK